MLLFVGLVSGLLLVCFFLACFITVIASGSGFNEVLINNLDAGNPLFLHANDNSSMSIVKFKLIGSENYKNVGYYYDSCFKREKQNVFYWWNMCQTRKQVLFCLINGKGVMPWLLVGLWDLYPKNCVLVKFILKLLLKFRKS